MNYKQHMIDASRTDLSEAEKLDLKFRKAGGEVLYEALVFGTVRDKWEDQKGYPIRKYFHDNELLATCISIRHLSKITGFSDQKVQQLIKIMETLNWIKKVNNCTLKGQTVYVLGRWYKVLDKDKKEIKIEELYRNIERDKYIKQKKTESENQIIEEEEPLKIEDIYPGGMESYFNRP